MSPSTRITWIPAIGRSRSGPRCTRPSRRCARCTTRGTSASRCEPPLAPGRRGGAPLLADGTGAGPADVQPACDVDLHEIEFEERILRHGFDHAADPAPADNLADQRPDRRRVAGYLASRRANAEFVIFGAGERVDHAARVPAEVPPLG